MDLQLAGKRALVTGSNSGIGRGIATVLAREGAQVIIHGRNRERAEATAEALRAAGGTAHVAVGDLMTDEGAAAVAKAAIEHLGGVDILVNNAGGNDAGGGGMPSWFEVTPAQWNLILQQNVIAAVRMIHALAPAMRERGWGRVINIASGGGVQATSLVPDYCAAKAAIINMTVGLAKELSRTGVTVNTISPGCTRTEAFEIWLSSLAESQGWPEDYETRETKFMDLGYFPVATKRLGRPDDIGTMVAFLASPAGDFVTGANYRVDGGQCQSVN
jgi:3-oxoacyl-[acyl-carrier protein] reductase